MNSFDRHTTQTVPSPAGALPIPEPETLEPVSSQETLDQAVATLYATKDVWTRMELASKVAILDELHHDMSQVGTRWVAASLQAKGVPAGGFAEGEEWAVFGGILRLLRMLRQSLRSIDRYGHPTLPGRPITLRNGQVSVPTFPTAPLERMLLPGMHAETWLEPGVQLEEPFTTPPPAGRIALVLGAGNMGVIQCADLLHKLFVDNQVVALKMNPVNAYLGPLLEEGFRALIKCGSLRILSGGADVGAYLSNHPLVETLHLTGSDKTFESIVFGPDEEGQRRKALHKPRLTKPITAELGGVNPVIIVPGGWSANDIKRAALMLATWLYSNAGFNCLSPRLIIQHRQWPQRQALLDALGHILEKTPLRPAYYPGARARHAVFLAAHRKTQLYGITDADHDVEGDTLPWTLIPDVDSTMENDICFKTESFCSLLSETSLDAENTSDFLDKATAFANHAVWGTLAATLLVPDKAKADKKISTALHRAVANLNYGTICINQYTGFAYSQMNIPWGSFPGQEVWNIQSGIGFIHNPFMLRKPQKSIFYAPFNRIDPVTLRHRSVATFCRYYADFQSRPSLGKLLKLLRPAIVSA